MSKEALGCCRLIQGRKSFVSSLELASCQALFFSRSLLILFFFFVFFVLAGREGEFYRVQSKKSCCSRQLVFVDSKELCGNWKREVAFESRSLFFLVRRICSAEAFEALV